MAKVDKVTVQKISPESLADLNDELAAMIRAGIPLDEGLRSAARHLRKDARNFVERLVTRIEQGSTLDEAIDIESQDLPVAYSSLIKSGIRIGRLPEALSAYTSFSRSRMKLRQELGNSLLYPVIVLFMSFLLSLFVCFIIFPRLLYIHDEFQLQSTSLMRSVYEFFKFYQVWYWIIPSVFLLFFFSWKINRSSFLITWKQNDPLLRKIFTAIAYGWIPGHRTLINEMNYSTFAEMSGMLLSYNVPLTESISLAAESTGNAKIICDSKSLSHLLEQGASLEEGIRSCKQYPMFIKSMMIEKNNQNHLPNVMSEIARVYRTRVMTRIDWIKNVIPVILLIAVAGGITAFYTIIVFLPFVEILKMLGSPMI